MAVASFDELNILDSGLFEVPEEQMRSMPYEQYFGDMYLTEEQIDDRVETAEDLEEPMMIFLLLLLMAKENNYPMQIAGDALVQQLEARDLGDEEYRETLADELVESTMMHSDDPWYYSEDRAFFIAENESNTLENLKDFERAKARGMTRKQWKGIGDSRERKTHLALNDTILPIDELFQIGFGQGRFPKDYEMLASHPEETISCRCSIIYLP